MSNVKYNLMAQTKKSIYKNQNSNVDVIIHGGNYNPNVKDNSDYVRDYFYFGNLEILAYSKTISTGKLNVKIKIEDSITKNSFILIVDMMILKNLFPNIKSSIVLTDDYVNSSRDSDAFFTYIYSNSLTQLSPNFTENVDGVYVRNHELTNILKFDLENNRNQSQYYTRNVEGLNSIFKGTETYYMQVGSFENTNSDGLPIGKYSNKIFIKESAIYCNGYVHRIPLITDINNLVIGSPSNESSNLFSFNSGHIYMFQKYSKPYIYIDKVYSAKLYKKINISSALTKVSGETSNLFIAYDAELVSRFTEDGELNLEAMVSHLLEKYTVNELYLNLTILGVNISQYLHKPKPLNNYPIIAFKEYDLKMVLEKIRAKFSAEYLSDFCKMVACKSILTFDNYLTQRNLVEYRNMASNLKVTVDYTQLNNYKEQHKKMFELMINDIQNLKLEELSIKEISRHLSSSSLTSLYKPLLVVISRVFEHLVKSNQDNQVFEEFSQGVYLSFISEDKKEFEGLRKNIVLQNICNSILNMV